MKYPLSDFQLLLREFQCFFFGHKWKSSWSRKKDADKIDYNSLPYSIRKTENPYCHYLAWWHSKCTRCRLKTVEDTWYPWYKNLWWGFESGIDSVKFNIHLSSEYKIPVLVIILSLLISPLTIIRNILTYSDILPNMLWVILEDLEYKIFNLMIDYDG